MCHVQTFPLATCARSDPHRLTPPPARSAFENELARAAEDQALVLVEYYQPRCMSCRALRAKFDTLARNRPDIRLFEVNTLSSGGKDILEAVPRPKALPTISLYAGTKRAVDAPTWTGVVQPKEWKSVLEIVDEYDEASDGESEDVRLA